MGALLEINNLKTYFYASGKVIPAVDGVSFTINMGETLCLVGESGSGKSVTALSILRLIPTPQGRYVEGEIIFDGQNLLKKPEKSMYDIRGNDISMVYQDPMTSLNPVFTIGMQIREALRIHKGLSRRQADAQVACMLSLVGIPDPEALLKDYPHQLSGGMRQRVMIAMALCCEPRLLLADEPTTALDVTIQAQILDLLRTLKRELGMAILFITHDLGVVAEMAERVVVMYAGRIVEEAPVKNLFAQPLHPYTEGLITCIPKIENSVSRLNVIEGMVPPPSNFPPGCRFHPRCPYTQPLCSVQAPETTQHGASKVACHFPLFKERLHRDVTA
ncbi:ABC transporter ATP-binding protein [Deltaproteobacteria bacterium]|nr:ABC transporter ATP-binding protein [Deltaproteobacteria bacterium]